jgi:hypothetical protein
MSHRARVVTEMPIAGPVQGSEQVSAVEPALTVQTPDTNTLTNIHTHTHTIDGCDQGLLEVNERADKLLQDLQRCSTSINTQSEEHRDSISGSCSKGIIPQLPRPPTAEWSSAASRSCSSRSRCGSNDMQKKKGRNTQRDKSVRIRQT